MSTQIGSDDSAADSMAPVNGAVPARVATPTSTGGAGTTFEQHVGAYWLAQLLVSAIPPILIDTTVTEVSFQTERLGWDTDDFLVVGTFGDVQRHLAGQVKRSFTVSASDEECVDAVTDFWNDFNAPHFSKDHDRLTLVTLRGTNTLLEHFVGLLDCARAARDGVDFEQRLSTKGFVSDTSRRYCGELQKIIGNAAGTAISPGDIWPFLRVLHVLSLDLHSATRQAEAQVKSMLALTTVEGDPVASAAASWNELVAEASTAMAAGRSLRRDNLPPAMLARHGMIGTSERRVVQALSDHTVPVLRAIHSTLGREFHLPRAALVQEVLDALENASVVLVTGPAGSGKSAVGKDAVGALALDHFLFGFRVEEFAEAHLDMTLAGAQVPANWTKLRAILGAQDRKVILVESVERLLEKTTRDAFTDLITLAADDPGLRLVLTCRDYSVEQVRASFLTAHGINHAVVRVPPLEDDELAAAEAAYPALQVPLQNALLREILRNPFFLDKALSINWQAERQLPASEREFRELFWREIVGAENKVDAGMGRRREQTFQEIAVRRARALSAYALCNDQDPAVIESLRRDSLIIKSDASKLLVATSHDVLEDWAILQWLEEQHLTQTSLEGLSSAIGTHPAIRRSYRRWVGELIERDPGAADALFGNSLAESDVSQQFRDDTLIAFLRAPEARHFLERHERELLADNRAVLRRVIHLLRVACVRLPDWLAAVGKFEHGSALNVPDGESWAAVLCLVRRQLPNFAVQDADLLLGFAEDAVRGVTWWAPDLDGAQDVAAIAHWLLQTLVPYSQRELRTRVLKVLLKIPAADARQFEVLLRGGASASGQRDLVADDLRELIYTGIEGMPASRDLPELVLEVGADYLLANDEAARRGRYSSSPSEIELYFGITESVHFDAFPDSAIHGPWIHLLKFHPEKALRFYYKVFNHSVEWYVNPRLPGRLEPAWQVDLTFNDGTTRKQWVNPRLWGLFRGDMAVGPYVLKSMLEALEKWLFEVATRSENRLDTLLLSILRSSDSASLAAVVASVAIAHPHACGETLLVLLSARDYIEIDRGRLVAERQVGVMTGFLPSYRADHQAYESERKEANAMKHRNHDLEAAIAMLQFGPLAHRVQQIFDRHLAALPPKEQQDEQDRVWRLAIHRMDLRQHPPVEVPPPANEGDAEGSTRSYFRFEPKALDEDLQAMVSRSAAQLGDWNQRLSVLNWGLAAFAGDAKNFADGEWMENLDAARMIDRDADHQDGTRNGPGIVAAVCIRDRWSDMTEDQREWCLSVACAEVARHADDWASDYGMQRSPLAADRRCASVIPSLLGEHLPESQQVRVREAIAIAMTHANEEVRRHIDWAIDVTFWLAHPEVATRCVNAIATEARLVEAAWGEEQSRRYPERREYREIAAEKAQLVRHGFWDDALVHADAHVLVDISHGAGARALERVLAILGGIAQEQLAIGAFERASSALALWWSYRDDDYSKRRERNYHVEAAVSEHLQNFLLRTTPEAATVVLGPILGAVDRHSDEVKSIVEGLTTLQDRSPNTPQYWLLWSQFAEAIRRARWLTRLDGRRSEGQGLLRAIFLNAHWQPGVKHWRSLEGYADLVHELFDALPAASVVIASYVRFLYDVGERSLPSAFVRVSDALKRGDSYAMLGGTDTVFVLEVLLQRYVYGRPLELKQERRIRESVLFLLDALVDRGSSAAFRMRDDFVTPVAA
jgi:hypothetical protein